MNKPDLLTQAGRLDLIEEVVVGLVVPDFPKLAPVVREAVALSVVRLLADRMQRARAGADLPFTRPPAGARPTLVPAEDERLQMGEHP